MRIAAIATYGFKAAIISFESKGVCVARIPLGYYLWQQCASGKKLLLMPLTDPPTPASNPHPPTHAVASLRMVQWRVEKYRTILRVGQPMSRWSDRVWFSTATTDEQDNRTADQISGIAKMPL